MSASSSSARRAVDFSAQRPACSKASANRWRWSALPSIRSVPPWGSTVSAVSWVVSVSLFFHGHDAQARARTDAGLRQRLPRQ